MQAYKCKICGGDVNVDRATGIAICEYCGTKQVLPQFSTDSSKRLYESGYSYLQNGEYDKAETVFNQLLAVNPQDAEIYWDIVLCKYGVTFVNDLKTGKYIPTCNRTYYESILNDKNYQNVLKYSNTEQSAFYQESAETINRIQKGILAVSKKEKPFDIFISYKETDSEGNRTKDSIAAQRLYEKLTESGYKVFFSRITLEDKIGTEYEPYIYAALYSSKVMLTVCSSKENIESPWVKNEWSRFLTLRQNDSEKILIPLCLDMPTKNLPDEFALLSSFDMKAEGFEQEFLHGIKKLIPLPIMKAERRKKIKKMVGIATSAVAALAVIVLAVFLPQHIKNIKYGKQYAEAIKLFENAEYENAATAFNDLNGYKDSIEMVKKCRIQPDYDAAMKLYSEGDYAQATWAFESLGDYEDSAQKKKQAELSWRKSLATFATDDLDEYSNSCYVINENGTVNEINGNAASNLSIEKHGKIISITPSADKLYALHEDGYVSNCKENNQLSNDSEWHNIIKISRQLSCTNIALRADGTMLYGNIETEDNWIKSISEWKDIIDFSLYYPGGLAYSECIGAIIGIKADGTLCAVYNDNNDAAMQFINYGNGSQSLGTFSTEKLNRIIEKFSNIKSVSFYIDNSPIKIIAITRTGKMQIYQDDAFKEVDADDLCDTFAAKFILKHNGDLLKNSNGKIILHDIVQLCCSGKDSGYAITRTGNVYQCDFVYDDYADDWKKVNFKSNVYDEWVSRLN